jgi:translation elongation factor EF-Tu-like GTPase
VVLKFLQLFLSLKENMQFINLFFAILISGAIYGQSAQPATPRVPLPLPDSSFYMVVEDLFKISGVGLAVTGKITTGKVAIGQTVEIKSFSEKPVEAKVTKIEMYGNPNLTTAKAGDNVGLVFAALKPEQVQRGMVVTQTGFGMLTKSANVELQTLKKAPKYVNGSKVMIYINGADMYDCVIEMEADGSIAPGQNKKVKINFPKYVTIIPNLGIAIRNLQFSTVGLGKVILQ